MNGFANATYIIGKKVVKTSEIRYNEAVKLILNFEKRGQNNVTNYTDSNIPVNLEYPKNHKGANTNRYFSTWQCLKTGTVFFNTWAPGSNKPPSKKFDPIINYILDNSKYVKKPKTVGG